MDEASSQGSYMVRVNSDSHHTKIERKKTTEVETSSEGSYFIRADDNPNKADTKIVSIFYATFNKYFFL